MDICCKVISHRPITKTYLMLFMIHPTGTVAGVVVALLVVIVIGILIYVFCIYKNTTKEKVSFTQGKCQKARLT